MSTTLGKEGVRLSAESVENVRSLCAHVLRSKPGSAIGKILAEIILGDLEAAPPYFGHLTYETRPGEARRHSAGEPDQDPKTGDVCGGLNL